MTAPEVEELEAWLHRRDRRANRLAVIALSLSLLIPVLVVDSGGAWVGSALFVAVLGHELGHRLAGHRGPRLHLATLFGVRPHPADGPAALFWRQAGSGLVGLLMGALALLVSPLSRLVWLEWLGVALVGISSLSLLPLPLCDGGQLLDRVFFARAPFVSFSIQLAAVVALTLVAVPAIAVMVVLPVPFTALAIRGFRVARLRARVLALGLPVAASPAAALEAVAAAGLGELPFARRRHLAAALLAGVGGPAPPAPTVGALAVVYLAALIAGPLILAAR